MLREEQLRVEGGDPSEKRPKCFVLFSISPFLFAARFTIVSMYLVRLPQACQTGSAGWNSFGRHRDQLTISKLTCVLRCTPFLGDVSNVGECVIFPSACAIRHTYGKGRPSRRLSEGDDSPKMNHSIMPSLRAMGRGNVCGRNDNNKRW